MGENIPVLRSPESKKQVFVYEYFAWFFFSNFNKLFFKLNFGSLFPPELQFFLTIKLCFSLPPDHLLLTSAHRVKALILEEIALDSNELISVQFYKEAELLHQNALVLSLKHFGENNVQTAKHYGNIGRLYQSMQKFDVSEEARETFNFSALKVFLCLDTPLDHPGVKSMFYYFP